MGDHRSRHPDDILLLKPHRRPPSTTSATFINVLITSRLNYFKSLLYGLPHKTTKNLQYLHNSDTHLLTSIRR
ncbi:hypothetical protein AALO_G00297170 [Alosa alosa]|uniref:Uncharacterized protein n=1 Tax=Alosa alosa TaxID=278164 RepID=A0AAV6FDK7_9TELE|nr:hypothetical protein AALO_G00297170 [Alosa alosa]